MQRQKITKTTFPTYLPEVLRKEAAEFLAEPVTDVLNICLLQGIYPDKDEQKYIDDLSTVEDMIREGKLTEYDVWQHIPSDIA